MRYDLGTFVVKTTKIVFIALLFIQSMNIASINPCKAVDEDIPLVIQCPLQVNESSIFFVQIMHNETPLGNATVIFNQQTKYSNSSGYTFFSGPRVLPQDNTTYPLVAYKDRLKPVQVNITVLNRLQLFLALDQTTIQTKTSFNITVYDDEGRIVENATLLFNNKKNYSDRNGTIPLIAPQVNKSKVYNMTITKEGYINNTILVIISPSASEENIVGLYIAIGILLFIAVFPVVVIIMRHFRRKKINRLK